MRRRDFLAAASAVLAAHTLTSSTRAADKPRIKAGQIGVAHAHAAGKMSAMRKFKDDYEIVGIAEPDEKLRKQHENDPVYRDLRWMSVEDLLAAPGLQVVAVETQVRELVPTAAKCIAAGVHIHLDKPAGESLAEFSKLLDEATRRKLTVQMGYMLRYNPAMQLCYQLARDGWLGELFEASATMSKLSGAATRKELAEYPGGIMFELGCHVVDSLVYVLGKPENVTAFGRKTHPKQDELVDNQLAVLEYPNATATVRSTLIEPHGEKRRQFVLCGSEGTIDIRPLEPGTKMQLALQKSRDPYKAGYQEITLPSAGGRYDGEFLDLARIVRGEKKADFTPQHDLAVHETILRASGLV